MASGFYIIMAIIAISIALVQATHVQPQKYTNTRKVKYFTDVEMQCDHLGLNISTSQTVLSIQWIFPDGSLVDVNTYLNPKSYQLSGVNDVPKPLSQGLDGYTLKVLQVDDDVFGYYTCLVLTSSSTGSGGTSGTENTVVAIRWGLNVHGADFSELIDTYKTNAIVGGIAAASALVLIASGCLVWYRCFNTDDKYLDEEDTNVPKHSIEMHENSGYVNDKEEKRSHVVGPNEMDVVNF